MTCEKLQIIAKADKKERSKTDKAQAYGIPLSTLSTYLKIKIILKTKHCKEQKFQNKNP